jgi:hypothetical protein
MNILADKDRDGIPDAFENISSNVVISGNMKIIVLTALQNCRPMSVPDTNRRWANWMQTKMGCRTFWKG